MAPAVTALVPVLPSPRAATAGCGRSAGIPCARVDCAARSPLLPISTAGPVSPSSSLQRCRSVPPWPSVLPLRARARSERLERSASPCELRAPIRGEASLDSSRRRPLRGAVQWNHFSAALRLCPGLRTVESAALPSQGRHCPSAVGCVGSSAGSSLQRPTVALRQLLQQRAPAWLLRAGRQLLPARW